MTIRLDTAKVLAHAAHLERAATTMDALRRRLDSVMAPVRRGDVPNLGSIEGTYGAASAALSQTKHSTGAMAAQVRQYVAGQLAVEAMMARLLPRLRADRWEAGTTVPGLTGFSPNQQLGLGANLASLGLQPFGGMGMAQVTKTTRYQVVFADGTTGWINASHVVMQPSSLGGVALTSAGKLVTVVGLVSDTHTLFFDRNATTIDQAQAALGLVSGGSTVVAGSANLAVGAGMGGTTGMWVAGTAGTVATWTGAAGATFAVTYTYSDYRRRQFEQDELTGTNTLQRIATSNSPTPVKAFDAGLYGLYEGSKAAGSAYWNWRLDVPKYEPAETRPNWQNTMILSEIRKAYPDARLSYVDGAVNVHIPAPAGSDKVTIISIDNETGRVT